MFTLLYLTINEFPLLKFAVPLSSEIKNDLPIQYLIPFTDQTGKMSINGKFYDIISNLYSKNKLYVRLGEYRNIFLNSNVGVRQGDVLSQIF